MIADLAVDPSQIVFLDDNQPNVDAARSLGIEAHLARGVGEARAVLAGLGIALRSTWDIGPELKSGKLVRALPDWESSANVGLYAVYPSRQFLPAKVRVFIDFLAGLYGPEPYWEL